MNYEGSMHSALSHCSRWKVFLRDHRMKRIAARVNTKSKARPDLNAFNSKARQNLNAFDSRRILFSGLTRIVCGDEGLENGVDSVSGV